MNRTLLQMLRSTCQECPETWPAKLDTMMAAYRMTTHKLTGVTPNQAMLGREVLLPATLIAKPSEEPVDVTVPFVKDLRDHIRMAHGKVRRATRAAAKTQKTYYDKSVRGTTFHVGQRVLDGPVGDSRIQNGRRCGDQTLVEKDEANCAHRPFVTLQWCRLPPPNCTISATPPEEPLATSPQIVAETEHQSSQFSAPPSPVQHSALSDRPRRKRHLSVVLESYVVG